jgi:hypothetical protein
MIESISKEAFFSVESLKLSWERYIKVGQQEIKDHVGINSFEWKLEENLKRLHEKIVENKFQPSEAFKFKVPKSNRMQRTLTLLQVEDAIVYQTFANKIATDSYDEVKKTEFNSFGFSTNDQVALGLDIFKEENPDYYFYKKYPAQYSKYKESIKENSLKFKLETDFTAFYDLISHEFLFQYLNDKFISSDEILDLFKSCLKEWGGKKNEYNTFTGIPQTEVASPFFANLVLHELDLVMIDKDNPYYRYMDDIWVFGDNEDELWDILLEIDNFATERGLCLNPKKTIIVEFSEDLDLIDFEPSGYIPIEIENFDTEDDFDGIIDIDNVYSHESIEPKEKMTVQEFVSNCADQISGGYYEINKLFKGTDDLNKRQQNKIVKHCYKIKLAFEAIIHYGYKPNIEESFDYNMFLELLSKYFWKCEHICYVLSFFDKNDDLGKGMLEILYKFKNYEWVVYHIARSLYKNQKLEDNEIHELLSLTLKTDSWFSKSSLYPLILENFENDSSNFETVKQCLFREENQQLLKNVIFGEDIGSKKIFNNSEIREIIRRN